MNDKKPAWASSIPSGISVELTQDKLIAKQREINKKLQEENKQLKDIAKSELKLSGAAWSEKLKITVVDPDGWDRKNFDESWAELITENEFKARLKMSTSIKTS